MRETAIMDVLTSSRDVPDGGWVPTSEKVIGADALSEPIGPKATAAEAAPMAAVAPVSSAPPAYRGGGQASFLSLQASQFEPPIRSFGPSSVAAPPARPAGFGPPSRAGSGIGAGGRPPALTPEDLEALEDLAFAARAGAPGAPAGPEPLGAVGHPFPPAAPSPAAAFPRSAPFGVAGAAGTAVPSSPPTDRARIVQPIPTWPPAGEPPVRSSPGAPAKHIGPVPSRHRPDPKRTARRRALTALALMVLAVAVGWILITKVRHPAHLAHPAPIAATAGAGHGSRDAEPGTS